MAFTSCFFVNIEYSRSRVIKIEENPESFKGLLQKAKKIMLIHLLRSVDTPYDLLMSMRSRIQSIDIMKVK